jgi:hypothetical protein
MNPLKTLTVSAVVLVASQAQAVPLLDHYLGGRNHGYGDVIGSPQLFDISRAEITRDQGRLKIDIFTNFVGHVRVYPTLTVNGKGIGYGDLFIGGAWTPFVATPNHPEYPSGHTCLAGAVADRISLKRRSLAAGSEKIQSANEEDLKRLRRMLGKVAGHDLEARVGFDRPVKVLEVPIDLDGEGGLGKAGPDRGCNVSAGGTARDRAHRAIRQGDTDLVGSACRHGGYS